MDVSNPSSPNVAAGILACRGAGASQPGGEGPAPLSIARDAHGASDPSTEVAANGCPETVRKIELSIAYMKEHLDQPLRVATLAAQASVSPSHFFALFKRRTGSAPMDYFTHLRMQYARRLLDGSSASVKEVAATMGYDDPFYFSRVFKSVNRLSPSQYRAMQKQPLQSLGRTNGNSASPLSLPANGKNHHRSFVHSF